MLDAFVTPCEGFRSILRSCVQVPFIIHFNTAAPILVYMCVLHVEHQFGMGGAS